MSAGERANIMGMFDGSGLESVSAGGGTQGFNYASSSNDFARVNALAATAPDFGKGSLQDVDRSNDVQFADNWASDPSQNRVLSDAGAGRGNAINVLRVDQQTAQATTNAYSGAGGGRGSINFNSAEYAAYQDDA